MRARGWAAMVALGLAVSACGSEQPQLMRVVAMDQLLVAKPPCLLTRVDKQAGALARAKLVKDVGRYLARQPGRIVFSARDLLTGATIGHREHEHGMITASGAKVDILTALLMRRGRVGEGERDLAERMIRESDNSAADALWWRVGAGGGMSGFYRRMGLSETTPGPGRFWGGTNTSPYDRIRLLRLLAQGGKGLTDGDREHVLGLMERVVPDQKWGISAAARPGDRVALKNGWTARPFVHNTWAVTSYGRVFGPGRDLLLSVQTDLQPGEGRGIQAIEGLARLVGSRIAGLHQVKAGSRPCAGEVVRPRGAGL